MGLISPEGENLLDFLELQQVLSSYDGDLRDPLCWPQERPVPMRVVRGPLGIPLPSMPGPKTWYGVGAGTGGFFSSADMDLWVLLESPQDSQAATARQGGCTRGSTCETLKGGRKQVGQGGGYTAAQETGFPGQWNSFPSLCQQRSV